MSGRGGGGVKIHEAFWGAFGWDFRGDVGWIDRVGSSPPCPGSYFGSLSDRFWGGAADFFEVSRFFAGFTPFTAG